jgi:hypothetical protein
MTERPIIMSASSVRAILEGRKTITRRVVKPQPSNASHIAHISLMPPKPDGTFEELWWDRIGSADGRVPACPFGVPGNRLWVRETWAWLGEEEVIYRAEPAFEALVEKWKTDPNYPQVKWSPAISMPRAASRITLEITKIRVERVQDISEEDCEAEGIDDAYLVKNHVAPPRRHSFKYLWDDLNADRGFGWNANPFVWVINFRRIDFRKPKGKKVRYELRADAK